MRPHAGVGLTIAPDGWIGKGFALTRGHLETAFRRGRTLPLRRFLPRKLFWRANMTYVRMYETEQQARDAVRKLVEAGFPDDTILLVTPGSGGAGSIEGISAALSAGFSLGGDVSAYAQGVQRGRSLVVVRAAFGFGQQAVSILESCGPVETETLPEPELPKKRYQAAPFSDFMGFPLLSSSQAGKCDAVELMSRVTMTNSFGYRLLSDKAAPLSSLFGLQILMNGGQMGNQSFGMPLLTDNTAPLSSTFGLPLLAGRR